MSLPTLYKRTSKGAIEQWKIWTEGADIVTEYGHVGGKMQTARETAVGKNIGKKNETTPEQQAESQAESDWKMKKSRKGYVEDLAKAQAGENDGAGGIRPMLAHKFTDYGEELTYPLYAQPKLDGIRCIAVVGDDNKVTLWSREQKPIVAVPIIAEQIAMMKLPVGTVLDGELYNHKLKSDFEKIVSCVRKQYEASKEEQELIEYHIYDLPRHPGLPPNAHFGDRATMMNVGLSRINALDWVDCQLVLVETKLLKNEGELLEYVDDCLSRGYEGAMARALEPYEENKRSHYLQKLKKFDDAEFLIVDVEEGVGKMAGLAIFVCTTLPPTLMAVPVDTFPKTLFRCKMEGSLENLRQYVDNKKLAVGKLLTVKYQGLTGKAKVPRFPVGKSIRDYE